MPTQTQSGKAFEFSLLTELFNILNKITSVKIIKDSSFEVALNCFNVFSQKEQAKYSEASKSASQHLLLLEPKLSNQINSKDEIAIQIMPDYSGGAGDVRDIVIIRSEQDWEIGLSAKNRHRAVKHSRLSRQIDFGKEWLNLPCSNIYFSEITPIFSELNQLKNQNFFWRDLGNKQERFYIPLLKQFFK